MYKLSYQLVLNPSPLLSCLTHENNSLSMSLSSFKSALESNSSLENQSSFSWEETLFKLALVRQKFWVIERKIMTAVLYASFSMRDSWNKLTSVILVALRAFESSYIAIFSVLFWFFMCWVRIILSFSFVIGIINAFLMAESRRIVAFFMISRQFCLSFYFLSRYFPIWFTFLKIKLFDITQTSPFSLQFFIFDSQIVFLKL